MDAKNQELLDMFNAGLANIKANGTYDEILAKYLGEQNRNMIFIGTWEYRKGFPRSCFQDFGSVKLEKISGYHGGSTFDTLIIKYILKENGK